jgi:transcriptional regulator with XRE-family HTH domain
MEKVIYKIKEIRKDKGYSHEYMAHLLDISQVAYSKIEKNETKLTVERLFKIAEILEAKIEDVLDIKADRIYNQDLKNTSIDHQETQNMYQDNKEVYEKLIASKDEQIALLKSYINEIKKS